MNHRREVEIVGCTSSRLNEAGAKVVAIQRLERAVDYYAGQNVARIWIKSSMTE